MARTGGTHEVEVVDDACRGCHKDTSCVTAWGGGCPWPNGTCGVVDHWKKPAQGLRRDLPCYLHASCLSSRICLEVDTSTARTTHDKCSREALEERTPEALMQALRERGSSQLNQLFWAGW
eukprot:TRINITY_DN15547_c0_g1_i2.p2 TRINITY_DN15547_c0_g1~~TRINITY_DN15547_c0_g1_i2.p2  ORF type:complete len:121 (-),score=6.16 TRINITY_DN15547_c0_g1_i2:54-416(-)